MTRDDIVPAGLLIGGLLLMAKASKKGPRSTKDRTGENCDPKEIAPFGYECGQVTGGWELREESTGWLGYGHYRNSEGVNEALMSLGFADGDLKGFQIYMSRISEWDLRKDGLVDRDTIIALDEAESLLRRDEWLFPPEGAMG